MREIIECLCNGVKIKQSYPISVRKFCLSLRGCSPAAYRYVRGKFLNNLPSEVTIRKWYQNSNIDSSEEICMYALNVLRKRADIFKNKNEQLICSIVFDEMFIKKHIQYCNESSEFIGFVENDIRNEYSESNPVINTTLFFMVCGVNDPGLKIPIAHYYRNSYTHEMKTEIIIEIVTEVTKCGVEISNITADGANAGVFNMLGANTSILRTNFKNPVNDNNIQVILDPSHMIKLIRNSLASRETIYDDANDAIKWSYLIKLVEYSRENHFNLTNKLGKRHIQWYERKMHVRTAVETLSSSVADSLEFLMRAGVSQFADAGPTIRFIRMFNDVFDIMNTTKIKSQSENQFKCALNPTNKQLIFDRLSEIKSYILALKIRQSDRNPQIVSVLDSDRKVGFLGFLLDIVSVQNIYQNYVEEKKILQFFPVHRISQDHLEIFFGLLRKMCGCNDNPTIQQLEAGLKKLSLQCDIQLLSNRSNVANEGTSAVSDSENIASDILTISSRKPQSLSEDIYLFNDLQPVEENSEIETMINERHEQLQIGNIEDANYLDDMINNAGIAYVAGKLEKKLLLCDQGCCSYCKLMLEKNAKVDASNCLLGYRPCIGTFKLCKLTATALKMYSHKENNVKNKVISYVLANIELENIYFTDFDVDQEVKDDHEEAHIDFIIKYFIDGFICEQRYKSARTQTLDLQRSFARQINRKSTHFAGQ